MTLPRPTELEPSHVLQERYQIVRPIGQGGMGSVFEAIDTRLGHVVAIKQTLLTGDEDLTGNDPLFRAFEREARILASLRHPALPAVSDFFTEDDAQYLVMQYIPGDDLWTLLQRNGLPFSVVDVLEWADRLLEVLDFLHTHQPQILHRDIKPQNLKLTPRGEIVLLDFGLARGTTAIPSMMTSGGSLVAYTPQYAPMEQIRGLQIDPRSDLYALAATLHHLLTGDLPSSAIERAAAAMEGKPDPLLPTAFMNSQIPIAVSDLLMRAMSPRIEERPASAAAMRAAMRRASAPAREMVTTRSSRQDTPAAEQSIAAPRTPQAARRPSRAPQPAQNAKPASQRALPPFAEIQRQFQSTLIKLINGIGQPEGIAVLAISCGLLLGLYIAIPRHSSAAQQSQIELQVPAATATSMDTRIRDGYQRTIETLSAAISVRPDDPRNYLSRADAYLALGNLDAATKDFTRVITLNPTNPAGYLGRGRTYIVQRQYALAQTDLERAVTLEPTSVEALLQRGRAAFYQRKYDQALADYSRHLELAPGSPDGLFNRGLAYSASGDQDRAIDDFNAFIKQQPKDASGYLYRAMALSRLGQRTEAAADLRQCLSLTDDLQIRTQAETLLKALAEE
jgi:serine/threonine protein kinase